MLLDLFATVGCNGGMDKTKTAGKRWDTTDVQGLYRDIQSGRYSGRFYIGGKEKWRALKTTDWKVAKRKFTERKAQVEGLRQSLGDSTAGTAKMGQLLDCVVVRLKDDPELSASSLARYLQLIAALLKTWPELAMMAPDRVTEDGVIQWRNRVARNGTGWVPMGAKGRSELCDGSSPGSINKMIDFLRRALRLAVAQGQIATDPLAAVKQLKLTDTPRTVELPENATLLAMCDDVEANAGRRPNKSPDKPSWYSRTHGKKNTALGLESADFMRFLIFTACRSNEAGTLTWRQVDLKGGAIDLGKGKTDAAQREIPLLPEASDLLRKVHARRLATTGTPSGNDPVFRVREITRSLARVCEKFGVNRLTHHDLRDALPTLAIENNADPKTLACVMGHADAGKLLLRVYTHQRKKSARDLMGKLRFAPVPAQSLLTG